MDEHKNCPHCGNPLSVWVREFGCTDSVRFGWTYTEDWWHCNECRKYIEPVPAKEEK